MTTVRFTPHTYNGYWWVRDNVTGDVVTNATGTRLAYHVNTWGFDEAARKAKEKAARLNAALTTPTDPLTLTAASDQFFDQNVRPELVKLETEAVLREIAEAVGDGSRADLLTALAKERDAARTAIRTAAAREMEELERMMQDRDGKGAE